MLLAVCVFLHILF